MCIYKSQKKRKKLNYLKEKFSKINLKSEKKDQDKLQIKFLKTDFILNFIFIKNGEKQKHTIITLINKKVSKYILFLFIYIFNV